jgi:hypothetical protein
LRADALRQKIEDSDRPTTNVHRSPAALDWDVVEEATRLMLKPNRLNNEPLKFRLVAAEHIVA